MKKGTLIAVGVFAVLLVLFFATRERKVSVGVRKLEVPAFDKAKVTALELSGAKAATLRKEGGTWVVSDPARPDKKYPADGQQVEAALDALPEVRGSNLVTEKRERHADLEVDDAKGLKVRVLGEKGPVVDLVIGKAARGGGTYVRRAGEDEVFSVTARFGWMVRKDVGGWRKRAFVPAKVDELVQVTVRPAGGEPFTLKPGAEAGSWALEDGATAPVGFRFDAQAGARLAHQLTTLNAQDFTDEAGDEGLGLAGAHDVLEAKLKDGKSLILHLGQEPDPAVFRAVSQLKAMFDAVDGASGTKDGKVTLEDLQRTLTDTTKSEELRKAIGRLVDDPAAFARVDAGGYAATGKDGALTQADLDGAARTVGLVPVRLEGDPQVYLVPSQAVAGLRKKLTDLRDLALLSFEPQKVTGVTIQTGRKKVRLSRDSGVWQVVEPRQLPAGFEFGPDEVDTQLRVLRRLRAARLVEPVVPDAQAGLARPSASVELTLEGGGSQVLRFGKEVPGKAAAKELFVRGSADQALYAVPLAERTRLEAGVDMFRKRPPPPMNMGGMQGLESLPPEIRRQLETQLRQQQQHP